jgi:hypothetical protein
MKKTLFDLLNHLSSETENRWEEYASVYNSFMINRFMSMHSDTVFYANEMNKSRLPKEEQYLFYLTSLTKKRRFFKYTKDEKDENLDELCAKYKINKATAKEYSELLAYK